MWAGISENAAACRQNIARNAPADLVRPHGLRGQTLATLAVTRSEGECR